MPSSRAPASDDLRAPVPERHRRSLPRGSARCRMSRLAGCGPARRSARGPGVEVAAEGLEEHGRRRAYVDLAIRVVDPFAALTTRLGAARYPPAEMTSRPCRSDLDF